jgi:hypothetical protein
MVFSRNFHFPQIFQKANFLEVEAIWGVVFICSEILILLKFQKIIRKFSGIRDNLGGMGWTFSFWFGREFSEVRWNLRGVGAFFSRKHVYFSWHYLVNRGWAIVKKSLLTQLIWRGDRPTHTRSRPPKSINEEDSWRKLIGWSRQGFRRSLPRGSRLYC